MTPALQKLLKEAENDAWQKLNSYRTLVEAVSSNKTEIFAQCLASRIINFCITECNQSNQSELINKLKTLLGESSK